MEPWSVAADDDRPKWTLLPTEGVGPLRFGIASDEVATVLGAQPTASRASRGRDGDAVRESDEFGTVGVTAYYGRGSLMTGVAVDALQGPQVSIDGLRLVARVPSELEREMAAFADRRGFELRYTHEGNCAAPDLGIVIRVQRAGDVVLTRPLLGPRIWAEDPWHAVDEAEWKVF